MPVTTFPSRWGPYTVTQVTMACEPAELKGCDGTVTQDVMTMEMTDQSETVSVIGGTLFKDRRGEVRRVVYDGQRRTVLKPAARKLYRSLLRQGYDPDRAWLNYDSL